MNFIDRSGPKITWICFARANRALAINQLVETSIGEPLTTALVQRPAPAHWPLLLFWHGFRATMLNVEA
jgi:hypothetical protein